MSSQTTGQPQGVVVTLSANQPSSNPSVVVIGPGQQVSVQYVLDTATANFGYYIAGFFDKTPGTRSYLTGSPRVQQPPAPNFNPPPTQQQMDAGYTIVNNNINTTQSAITIEIVLVIKHALYPGITILFDPQDQDSQA
jgi:hypothetical protein